MQMLSKRRKLELESNEKLLGQYWGMDICYGSEVQLKHVNSGSFLNGQLVCAESKKSAYRFELARSFGSGMIFKIIPKYKLRQEGEIIQYRDSVVLVNKKVNGYVNFWREECIELDRLDFDEHGNKVA